MKWGIQMIRFVVDSSADYLPEELKERNIELVPLRVTIGETTYKDGVDLAKNDFFQMLETTGLFPKTAQPSPQDFLEVFEDAKEKGDSVICILLSTGLSGTFQSASIAKEMAEYDNIYLIDSLLATVLIRVLVEQGRKMAVAGASAEEIVEALESLKHRVKVVAALDTLEYLARGGRISKAAASIGDLANLKPILTVTPDGKLAIIGKALGKLKAIAFIRKTITKDIIDFDYPIYSIFSYGEENCMKMEEKFALDGIKPEVRLQLGATIGAHIGPGAFGLIYVEK